MVVSMTSVMSTEGKVKDHVRIESVKVAWKVPSASRCRKFTSTPVAPGSSIKMFTLLVVAALILMRTQAPSEPSLVFKLAKTKGLDCKTLVPVVKARLGHDVKSSRSRWT